MDRLYKDVELQEPIKVHELKSITHLRIEIDHDKGGMSWGTGEMHKTGIKCNVTPIEKTQYGYSVLYDGKFEHQGFFVFLLDCGRKSPKKMQKVADVILPLADKVTEMFLRGEYREIAVLMTETVKSAKI
jgi:hypothetical protein